MLYYSSTVLCVVMTLKGWCVCVRVCVPVLSCAHLARQSFLLPGFLLGTWEQRGLLDQIRQLF